MESYKELIQRTNAAIAALQFPPQPQGLYEPISYVLALGGKRLRPVYTLLAAQLFGENTDRNMEAALSLEIFHNYTLLHDDLMDNADVRRNQPTVHKRWDSNTAILSGDAMLTYACKKMNAAVALTCPSVMSEFLKGALEVMEGQQYDMNFENLTDVTLEEYFEMIRLKTGVLISCALKIGALLGGASETQSQLLYDYGALIGKAFQVQDDYLDVFGDIKVFGKRIGGDILEGKKTFLLISAFQKANATQRCQMQEWLNMKNYEPQDKINFFTQMFRELDIPALCEQCMEECYTKADAILAQLDAPQEAKTLLQEFTQLLSQRRS